MIFYDFLALQPVMLLVKQYDTNGKQYSPISPPIFFCSHDLSEYSIHKGKKV